MGRTEYAVSFTMGDMVDATGVSAGGLVRLGLSCRYPGCKLPRSWESACDEHTPHLRYAHKVLGLWDEAEQSERERLDKLMDEWERRHPRPELDDLMRKYKGE